MNVDGSAHYGSLRYNLPAEFCEVDDGVALRRISRVPDPRASLNYTHVSVLNSADRTYEVDSPGKQQAAGRQVFGSLRTRGTLNSERTSTAVLTALTVVEIVPPVTIPRSVRVRELCPDGVASRVNTRLLFV